MLDKDLAELYGVNPRRLREQVKRNKARFPAHFMFRLKKNEVMGMVSQNATPSLGVFGGSMPYAFTEQGLLMLAAVLKSKTAIEISMRVIEIFVKMREILSANKEILVKLDLLEKKIMGHDHDIQTIFSALKQLLVAKPVRGNRIGFRRGDEKD